VLAAALVAVGAYRGRRPWEFSRGAWLASAATAGIGAVGATAALIPSSWVGDANIVMPNGSHDAFYYVTEATWLTQHPINPVPDAGLLPGGGNATPAFTSMRISLQLPLRIGQPLVHAALGSVLRIDELHSTMPTIALWVALVSAAAFVSGRLLRMSVTTSLAFALVASSSAVFLQQAYQQNMDALLGVSLALLAGAACLAAIATRSPMWPASVVLTGLVGVYTEYAIYIVPMVLGALLLRRRGYRRAAVRAATILAVAVLLSPTTWRRGIGALLVDRSGDALSSPFFSDGWYGAIGRVVGTVAISGPVLMSRATLVFAALVVAGCLFSVVFDRHRLSWALLLGVGFGYVIYLASQGRGYTQFRAVTLFTPLVLLATFVGWSGAVKAVSRRLPPRTPLIRVGTVAGGLAMLAVLGLWPVLNVKSAVRVLDRGLAEHRHVTPDFDEAAQWVRTLGGRDGADVTVLVPDLFAQLWTTYELRDDRLVSYVSLRPDYSGFTRYWAGESDRYLLVGPGAAEDAASQTVVRSNSTFKLLDTQAGPVTVVSPVDLATWIPRADAAGVMTGPSTARFQLLRSRVAPSRAGLTFASPGAVAAVPITVLVEETGQKFPGLAGPGSTPVVVDLPPGQVVTLTASIDSAVPGSTLALTGVSHAS
jgi:hypothetical protein